MKKLEVISYQLHMFIEYKMYLCVSYKGSKWGIQTAPPGKYLARCY